MHGTNIARQIARGADLIYNFLGRPTFTWQRADRREIYAHAAIFSGLAALLTKSWPSLIFGCLSSLFGMMIFLAANGRVFRTVWNVPLGKAAYALLALITVWLGHALSDRFILEMLQTSPDQFPSIQNVMSLLIMVTICVVIFYTTFSLAWILWVILLVFNAARESRTPARKHHYYSLAQLMSGVAFILSVIPYMYAPLSLASKPSTDNPSDRKHQPGDGLFFNVFLALAFVQNLVEGPSFHVDEERKVGVRSRTLVCNNIPGDSFVAFPKSDRIFPDEVLEAFKAPDAPNGYEFRRSHCDNSRAPDQSRTLTSEEPLSGP
jgi:hypothetical protein